MYIGKEKEQTDRRCILQRCPGIQALVTLEREHRLELPELVIQAPGLLLVELGTLDNLEEDILGNSLAKELQEVDTPGLVHLAHQGATQEQARALQEEAILREATLTLEQQEHPQAHHQADILAPHQGPLVAIQEVHLEVTQVRRLQASKGPILELLLRLLTLR